MNTVLYSLSFNYIDALYWAIPAALALAFHSAAQALLTSAQQNGTAGRSKTLLSLRLCSLIMLLVFVIGFGGSLLSYRRIHEKYLVGEYMTVSGTVENFQPLSLSGHGKESFTIGGIKFSYSDFILVHGYHNSGENSFITGNGQNLRLHYIDTGNERIIVEIQEQP